MNLPRSYNLRLTLPVLIISIINNTRESGPKTKKKAYYIPPDLTGRSVGDMPEPHHCIIGPLDVGHLKVTIFSQINSKFGIENHADIVFKASSSTIEAVKEATSTRWCLNYRLCSVFWEADKVSVECCIQIPNQLMEEASEIISEIKKLSEPTESDKFEKHSEFVIMLDHRVTNVREGELDKEIGTWQGSAA